MALTRLCPLLFLLPLCTLGQRYQTHQQPQQKQQQQQQHHPGNYNSFSPTCHVGVEGELLCDQCQPGYTGPRCDRCSNGYYGQPNVPGGSCRPCDCHGNLDLSKPGSCDPITGQCLRCRQGYGSASCDSCADGYYGDAIVAKNCQPCQCHTNGSESEVCDKETGRCQCMKDVTGRQCDECIPNCWWDDERQACIPCRCSRHGSVSQRCDIEGRCICRPGFLGQRCDLRRQSYERRETRRPVERVPIEVAQQRWGGSSRTGGCPRGAYKPKTGVTHAAWCVLKQHGCVYLVCKSVRYFYC